MRSDIFFVPISEIRGKTAGIYAIMSKENRRMYIGSSSDIRARTNRHRVLLKQGKHFSRHLQAAWDLRGVDAFRVFMIERVEDQSQLIAREQFWVDLLHANLPSCGYNTRIVVESRRGVPMSPEAKQRISASLKGRPVSDETRRKIAASNTGKCHSEETRKKLSIAQKGKLRKPMSDEHKRRISACNKGKKLSAEHRQKLSLSHMGNEHTADQTAKISRALKGIKRSADTRQKMSAAQKGAIQEQIPRFW